MKRLDRAIVAASIMLLMAATALATTFPVPNHQPLDLILKMLVKDDRVDYPRVGQGLNDYLDQFANVDIGIFDSREHLPAYINLYNATMIKAIADRYHPGYSTSEKDFAVFKEPLVRLNGRTISLNDLENKIIRPMFNDPRVHVALVCGARSCPPILPRAYRADDLDKVLDENMKRFVNDKKRNPIDAEHKKLRLSKIFDWYADDFGGKQSVAAFVGKYLGIDTADWPVEFVDYSWELNIVSR
jgi:hypothetical protein